MLAHAEKRASDSEDERAFRLADGDVRVRVPCAAAGLCGQRGASAARPGRHVETPCEARVRAGRCCSAWASLSRFSSLETSDLHSHLTQAIAVLREASGRWLTGAGLILLLRLTGQSARPPLRRATCQSANISSYLPESIERNASIAGPADMPKESGKSGCS